MINLSIALGTQKQSANPQEVDLVVDPTPEKNVLSLTDERSNNAFGKWTNIQSEGVHMTLPSQ